MGIRHTGEIGPSRRVSLTAGELEIDGSGNSAGRQQYGRLHSGLWRRRRCLVANEKIGWAAGRQHSILSVVAQPGPVSYTARRREAPGTRLQGSSNVVDSSSLATPEGGLVQHRGTRPLGYLFSLMIRLPGRILPTEDRQLQIVLFPSMEGPVGILPAVQCRSWLSTILLGDGQTCYCSGGPTSLSVPVSLKQRVQGQTIACIHETQ